MPALMTAQKETQFNPVVKNLLQCHTTSTAVDALEKCFGQGHTAPEDVDDILGMPDVDVKSLMCNARNAVTKMIIE